MKKRGKKSGASLGDLLALYAEPLMHNVDSEAEFEQTLNLAALMWNASQFPTGSAEASRQESDILAMMTEGVADPLFHAEAANELQRMVDRRREFFGQFRVIFGVVTVTPNDRGTMTVRVEAAPVDAFVELRDPDHSIMSEGQGS